MTTRRSGETTGAEELGDLYWCFYRDWVGLWRKDRRCGPEFPLPNGSGPTECNPESENFCCSKWGFCGGDGEHCGCPECVNYRN